MADEATIRVQAEAPPAAPPQPQVTVVPVTTVPAPSLPASEDMGEIKALLASMNAKLEAIASRPEPVAEVVEEPEPEPKAEEVAPPPPPPNPEPEAPPEEEKRSWLSRILHG